MLASLITRALQLLCAIIVLALSIRAAKWQMYGSVPATTVFVAFAGGFALLVSLVGIASIWISAIPALIMSMVDGFAAVLLLAGGIAYAIKIPGSNCGDPNSYSSSAGSIVLGGCHKSKGYEYCGYDDYDQVVGRCKVVKSDTAFLFIGFVACLGAAAVCFLAHKRGRSV